MTDETITALTDGGVAQASDWFVAARGGGNVKVAGHQLAVTTSLLDFTTFVGDRTITATTAATAQTVIDGNAVTYDGATDIKVEFFARFTSNSGAAYVIFNLWDGSTDLGRIAQNRGAASEGAPMYGVAYLTPSAGAHTYHVKAWVTSLTGTVVGNNTDPGFPIALRITTAAVVQPDGWSSDAAETWTYSSADAGGATYTFTVPGDLSAKYTPGVRLQLTQSATVRYFIVTAVAYSAGTTTVTVYGGTDYVLANAAITANYHSMLKAPRGFPLDPAKWTQRLRDTTQRTQTSPVQGTYYNMGGLSLDVPIGAWYVTYSVVLSAVRAASGFADAYATLSTSSTAESNGDLSSYGGMNLGGAGSVSVWLSVPPRRITVAAKTTHYLLGRYTSGTSSSLRFDNNSVPGIIDAVCAYL